MNKGPKWYPADDTKKPVPSRRHIHKPTKLRPTIKPGSVLILLAGAFRGSRVVFLKQLPSGMLLVTGPYAVNRIPLSPVNQAYVIATSTTVDISGVKVDKFDDAYFKVEKKTKDTAVMEVDSGAKDGKKVGLSEARLSDQEAIDDVLVPVVNKEPLLSSYLKTKFTLKKGQYPHEMKF